MNFFVSSKKITFKQLKDGDDWNHLKNWLYASRKINHYHIDRYGLLQIAVAPEMQVEEKRHQLTEDGGCFFPRHLEKRGGVYSKEHIAILRANPAQANYYSIENPLDDMISEQLVTFDKSYIDLRTGTYHGKKFNVKTLNDIDVNWMDYFNPNKPHRMRMSMWLRENSEKKRDWICDYCGRSVLPPDWLLLPMVKLPFMTWDQYKRIVMEHYTSCCGEQIAHLVLYQSALSKSAEDNWFQGYFTSSCLTGTIGVLISQNLQQQGVLFVISSRQGAFRKIEFASKDLCVEQKLEKMMEAETFVGF